MDKIRDRVVPLPNSRDSELARSTQYILPTRGFCGTKWYTEERLKINEVILVLRGRSRNNKKKHGLSHYVFSSIHVLDVPLPLARSGSQLFVHAVELASFSRGKILARPVQRLGLAGRQLLLPNSPSRAIMHKTFSAPSSSLFSSLPSTILLRATRPWLSVLHIWYDRRSSRARGTMNRADLTSH